MNGKSRITFGWPAAIIGAIVLIGAGVGGTYLWMRRSISPEAPATQTEPGPAAHTAPFSNARGGGPIADAVISLSQEGVKRAGIELAPVTTGAASSSVRIPGTVEANAYEQVVVTPLVAGRVAHVLVELGNRVRRGQTLAQVFSPDLAEAQMKYLSAKAELDAHERELARTQKLVEIGAASQQELERLHAEHAAKAAGVQSLQSRLVLLGMPASAIESLSPGRQVEATTNITAPIAGVVTERGANVGLNVDTSAKLFTVVDLSSVWVVGALYERDFSRVRVGTAATVTTSAYPGLALHGRVSYIDPQVSADTRTARVRVEVPNPKQELRLGMYADIEIAAATNRQTVTIPRSAVQSVGNRQVVYMAVESEPGKFVERNVQLGDASGNRVEVVSGVKAGDQIVSAGSFFVRAERERLGMGSMTDAAPQGVRITVGDQGYEPSRVTVRAGEPIHLTFVRTSDNTCGTAVVFPSLNLRRELPLNQPVEIALTPQNTGELQFVCGVDMLRGTVVVE